MKIYFWLVAALAIAGFPPAVAAQVSYGTAFVVAPGYLITNQHVIDGCRTVDVIAAGGRRTGSVVDADDRIDLALLRVTGITGSTARLRSPRNVRLGESVMVFGFPLTGSLSSGGNFTSGLVSATRGLQDTAGELQITAPVQPGNSGGPLMDASGLVIGVVQAKLDAIRAAIATGDIPQNVNFAISLEVLANFLIKNRVPFRDGPLSAALDTAKVAQLAQSFTYRVECQGRIQQAVASPSIKEGRLPPCRGPYAPATWTNCIGERIDPDGSLKYVGEFRDGSFHGQGSTEFTSGTTYVGQFRNGMPNGQGTWTSADGAKYVGELKNGAYHGQGTLTHPDDGKYVGEFRDSKFHGQGTLTHPNGGKYVGEFRDSKFHGQGSFTFAEGRKYVGEFRDGKLDGRGTSTWPNGQVYVGDVKDGKRNGHGTLTLPDGQKYTGAFKDDKLHGQGVLYRANGSILDAGIFDNGVFIRSR